MMAAYRSGDPYLAFAKQAGAAPADATKATHKAVRDNSSTCAGRPVRYGSRGLGAAHRSAADPGSRTAAAASRNLPVFWRWSDAAVDHAMLTGSLHTVLAGGSRCRRNRTPRSLRNFPMQANGAEMLRLACCLATERGIEVCAPVHDAVLICAPLDRWMPMWRGCRTRCARRRISCSTVSS